MAAYTKWYSESGTNCLLNFGAYSVCSSSISNASADHDLRLPNGTYALTAQDCIQCRCSSNTFQYATELPCFHISWAVSLSQAADRRITISFPCGDQARLHRAARQEGVPGSAAVQRRAEAWDDERCRLRIHDVRLQWLFQQLFTQHTDHSFQKPDSTSMRE